MRIRGAMHFVRGADFLDEFDCGHESPQRHRFEKIGVETIASEIGIFVRRPRHQAIRLAARGLQLRSDSDAALRKSGAIGCSKAHLIQAIDGTRKGARFYEARQASKDAAGKEIFGDGLSKYNAQRQFGCDDAAVAKGVWRSTCLLSSRDAALIVPNTLSTDARDPAPANLSPAQRLAGLSFSTENRSRLLASRGLAYSVNFPCRF